MVESITRLLFLLTTLQGTCLKSRVAASNSHGDTIPQTGDQPFWSRDSRIIGGTEAAPNAHPYLAAVQIYDKMDKAWYNECAGTIIKSDTIVTAGFCAYVVLNLKLGQQQEWRVVAIEQDLLEYDGTEQYRSIASVMHYPQFNLSTLNFDFGVIRLSQPLTLNTVVSAISLSQKEPADGSDCVVMGWGSIQADVVIRPTRPHYVTVSIVPRGQCSKSVHVIKERVCAEAAGRGFCSGDRGGPLMCNGVLAGIVSKDNSPCPVSKPGIYANIAAAYEWFSS